MIICGTCNVYGVCGQTVRICRKKSLSTTHKQFKNGTLKPLFLNTAAINLMVQAALLTLYNILSVNMRNI